jgi:amino acid transporter
MEAMSELNKQRAIDTVAILFVIALASIIGLFTSAIIAAAFISSYYPGRPDHDNPVQGVFMMLAWLIAFFLLSPLWLWLAVRIRGFLNWPKGAFRTAQK